MDISQIKMILQFVRFQLDEIEDSLENDNIDIVIDINDIISKLKNIKKLVKQ